MALVASLLVLVAPAGAAPSQPPAAVSAAPTASTPGATGEALTADDVAALTGQPLEVPIYAKDQPTRQSPLQPGPAAPTVAVTHQDTPAGTMTLGPASSFVVSYDAGFDSAPAAKISFQAAVDVWASTLVSTVPIAVTAKFGTTACGGSAFPSMVLGSAGPGALRRNFANAPVANAWYPRAMADAFAGTDLDPGQPDICAAFNSAFPNWYFGTTGFPGNNFDFESVVMHELGHGLGFIGSMTASGGTADCCFSTQGSLAGPMMYDLKTFTGVGTALLSLPHPSAELLAALQGGAVSFRGTATNAAAAASPWGAKLFAPPTFQPGSSYSHLDEDTYDDLSGNALMTPGISPGEVEHAPGPLAIGMFQDMGWGVSATIPGAPTNVTGVPGNGAVTVAWTAPVDDGGATITGYTATSSPEGKTCSWTVGPRTCTVAGLTNGTAYTFTVRATNSIGQGPPSAASPPVVPEAPPTVPGAPLNPLATAGTGSATVTWSPPASDGGAAITSYTVTSSPENLTCTWTSGPLTCTVLGLTNGTPYRFSVTATNSVGPGPASTLSNQIAPGSTTVPSAPSGASATAGKQSARVTWSAPASPGGSPIISFVVTSSPGNQTCTWIGGPLECVVLGLDAGTSYTFTVRATNNAGFSPPSAASNPPVVPWSGSFFHALAPTRLLDSRTGLGFTGGVVAGAANTRALHVTGAGVPDTAAAVVLNVTATAGTANSFLTVFPSGENVPSASNLNFAAGETIPNLVTVKVGAAGNVSFFNAIGTVQVVADIVGFYDDGTVSGDRFNALDPTRILDTRSGTGFSGKVNGGAANTRDLTVPSNVVPGTASAVVVNITATGGTLGSFLTAFPSGTTLPTASNLNFGPGQTIPNLAVVKIGANDKISLFNALGSVDVVIDVVGYFDAGGGAFFHALSPDRILDSRTVVGGFNGPVVAGTPKLLTVSGANGVPASATAAVLNTTVTGGTNASFLTVFPTGGAVPNASNLNFAAGQTIPNLVTVKLGTGGRASFANAIGAVNTIADLVGYYAPS